MSHTRRSTLFIGCAVAVACARPQPPVELRSARAAYERARAGPAADANPAGLYEARQALMAAERIEEDDPGSADARSLAYVAKRRAELAEADARAAIHAAREAEALRALREAREGPDSDAAADRKARRERRGKP